MYADEEGCGYDAPFTSEVPEYLKCVVCHLVLRNPVQIVQCGHQFCQQCFERIKNYSQHLNTQLCCPIDRDVINLNEVFKDTSLGRIVGNLEVNCRNNEIGCSWTGDLRDFQNHGENCEHKVTQKLEDLSMQKEGDPVLLKDLCKRLGTCENAMMEREKDVAHLKYNLHELKTNFNAKVTETISLKKKADENEKEIQKIKELNQQITVQFDKDIQLLMNQNQLIEGKVDTLENNLLEREKVSQDKDMETYFKNKMVEMKNELSEKINTLSNEMKNVRSQSDKQSSMNVDLVKVQEEINKLTKEIRSSESHLDESMNKTKDEINKLTVQVSAADKLKDDVKDVVEHVENIENILFCHQFSGNNHVRLKWIMSDYQRLATLAENVYSPQFYTEINGYCFQLNVQWGVDKKENVGVGLFLCRGKGVSKTLKPFNIQFKLEVIGEKGETKSQTVPLSVINIMQEAFFTLHPNENRSRKCFRMFMLKMPTNKNYIINDMLTIYCTIEC